MGMKTVFPNFGIESLEKVWNGNSCSCLMPDNDADEYNDEYNNEYYDEYKNEYYDEYNNKYYDEYNNENCDEYNNEYYDDNDDVDGEIHRSFQQ